MHRITARLSLALALAAALALAGLSRPRAAVAQATTDTISQSFPISLTQFYPCANGGAGELVSISGDLHTVMHLTINDNHLAAEFHAHPQRLVGTGLTTGDTYRLVGGDHSVTSLQLDGGTRVFNAVSNILVVGPGPDNNTVSHSTIHTTFNHNGELTSMHVTADADCR